MLARCYANSNRYSVATLQRNRLQERYRYCANELSANKRNKSG